MTRLQILAAADTLAMMASQSEPSKLFTPDEVDDAIEAACEMDRLAVAIEAGWLPPPEPGWTYVRRL
jgi:hypothetical protein